jgi:hypothetical protein
MWDMGVSDEELRNAAEAAEASEKGLSAIVEATPGPSGVNQVGGEGGDDEMWDLSCKSPITYDAPFSVTDPLVDYQAKSAELELHRDWLKNPSSNLALRRRRTVVDLTADSSSSTTESDLAKESDLQDFDPDDVRGCFPQSCPYYVGLDGSLHSWDYSIAPTDTPPSPSLLRKQSPNTLISPTDLIGIEPSTHPWSDPYKNVAACVIQKFPSEPPTDINEQIAIVRAFLKLQYGNTWTCGILKSVVRQLGFTENYCDIFDNLFGETV